jgi:hypothetical protein
VFKPEDFVYYDLQRRVKSGQIDLLFPGWKPKDERIAIFCPHDDDGILGAGYALLAALANQAEVYICIFCDGRAGYSRVEDRETIVARRKGESAAAYAALGVPESHIIRFNYPDFSMPGWLGWRLPDGQLGTLSQTLCTMRTHQITRLLIPNGYREHIDHEAVYRAGAYDGPQVGDPVLVDWGTAEPIRSTAVYAVWGDLTPEDALVAGRAANLRGNRAIAAPLTVEKAIMDSLRAFVSQGQIIEGLVAARAGRKQDQRVIEAYLSFDPRPALDYRPYHRAIMDIDGLKRV